MLQVTIHTSSGRPVEKVFSDIPNGINMGGKKGMTQIARTLTQALKTEVPFWKGNLMDSIRSRTLSENEVGVFMNWYGHLVAKGHPINTISMSQHSAFWRWIQDKALESPEAFRWALLKKGFTDPNDFITRALTRVENKFGKEALEEIRMELKRRGFR